jgi:hypothetical protein
VISLFFSILNVFTHKIPFMTGIFAQWHIFEIIGLIFVVIVQNVINEQNNMKKLFTWVMFLVIWSPAVLGQLRSTEKVQHPFQLDIGFGAGLLKAGRAYDINPLFYTEGAGFHIYGAPKYYTSENLALGLTVGGVFRPTFTSRLGDTLNVRSEREFTPFALLTAERYFSSAAHPRRRFYVGLSAGTTYVGYIQARDLDNDRNFGYVPRENRFYITAAPKIGVAFSEFKIELHYNVTFRYNPDFLGLTIVCPVRASRPTYFLGDDKL